MFENLATIDWASLTHAYGHASDVPDLLCALASRNHRKRQEALQTLFSTIWHQGTVYEATSFAVPFLCELLRADDVEGKVGVLGLIQAINSAHPRNDAQPDPLWREKPSALDAIHQTESSRRARQAREAVLAEVGTFMSMLAVDAPFLRGCAAFTLASCEGEFPRIEPVLRQRINDEEHPIVKATLIYVWAALWRKSGQDPTLMKKRLLRLARNVHQKPVVRLMSAMALVPILRKGPHPKLTRFLAWAFRRSGKALACMSRLDGSFDAKGALADRHDLKVELCLRLATKPKRSLKAHILFDLEELCREHRGNFARVIPALGQLLSDDDPELRANVAMKLSQMGTWSRFAREPLIHALEDSNRSVALWAAVALSKLRDPRVLPFLFASLAPEKHTDSLGNQITADTPISDILHIQQAVNKHLQSLRLLLDALRPYGPQGSGVLPHLLTLLTTRGPQIQNLLCPALASIGKPAEVAVPAVAKLLQNTECQPAAAWALMHWGSTARKAIPSLVRFLQEFLQADHWARTSAIKALGIMGPSAKETMSVLKQHLGDSDCAIKSEAALAMWRIEPRTPKIIDVLTDELKERTKPGWATHGCVQVVMALEAIGPAAKLAEPSLEALLGDPDGWSRVHAARALWNMRGRLPLFLPVLIDDLLCRPLGIRTGLLAAECLAEIGPPAAAAIPRLQELLARDESLADHGTGWVESDESFQNAVARALRSIAGESVVRRENQDA